MALFKINSQHIEEGAITQELLDVSVSESISSLKISNVSLANSTYHILDDTAVNIGGGYIVVTGSGFNSNSIISVGSSQALSTSYVNSTTLRAQVDAASARTYDVYVTNDDGDVALKKNGLTYSGTPTWVTASSLTAQINAISFTGTFEATGATSYANTTALPSGFNLVSANGYYYGNIGVESDTTYNFTIRASDDELQESDRSFSLDVITAIPVEYLVVAGGGGGGQSSPGGGGGGAGGLLTGTNYITPGSGTTNVIVGAGGLGNGYYIYYDGTFYGKTAGSNSSFGGISTIGGGIGGSPNPGEYTGGYGGSGGGSIVYAAAGGPGTPGQGNNGGIGASGPSTEYAGGGGGAGAAGGNATSSGAGSGGVGIESSISGTATYYAGGGAAYGGASGGLGGGGSSVPYNSNGDAGSAQVNTGGGGGGGVQTNSGRGGSGIVILRHPDSFAERTTTGSPTITTSGGYRIYKFTGSGSITW